MRKIGIVPDGKTGLQVSLIFGAIGGVIGLNRSQIPIKPTATNSEAARARIYWATAPKAS